MPVSVASTRMRRIRDGLNLGWHVNAGKRRITVRVAERRLNLNRHFNAGSVAPPRMRRSATPEFRPAFQCR